MCFAFVNFTRTLPMVGQYKGMLMSAYSKLCINFMRYVNGSCKNFKCYLSCSSAFGKENFQGFQISRRRLRVLNYIYKKFVIMQFLKFWTAGEDQSLKRPQFTETPREALSSLQFFQFTRASLSRIPIEWWASVKLQPQDRVVWKNLGFVWGNGNDCN